MSNMYIWGSNETIWGVKTIKNLEEFKNKLIELPRDTALSNEFSITGSPDELVTRYIKYLNMPKEEKISNSFSKETVGKIEAYTEEMIVAKEFLLPHFFQTNNKSIINDMFVRVYLTGNTELAAEYFVNFGGEIDLYSNAHDFYIHVIVADLLMRTNDFDAAKFLYGWLGKQNHLISREKGTEIYKKLIDVLKRILETAKNEFKAWYEIFVFEEKNGNNIINTIKMAEERLDNKLFPSTEQHDFLFDFAYALATKNNYRFFDTEPFNKPLIIEDATKDLSEVLLYRRHLFSLIIEPYLKDITNILSVRVQQKMEELVNAQIFDYIDSINKFIDKYKKDEDNEELEKLLNDIIKGFPVGRHTLKIVESNLSNWQKDFFKQNDIKNETDLLEKLDETEKTNLKKFIVTAETVYSYLNEIDETGESSDYSAALIPMCKALELIGNCIFKELEPKTTPVDNWNFYYTERACINKKYLTLGSFYFIFENNGAKWELAQRLCEANAGHLSKIEFTTEEDDKSIATERINNEGNNLYEILFKSLRYITNEYRNRNAHSNTANKNDAKKCRSLLFETEQMIWVLLYLLK